MTVSTLHRLMQHCVQKVKKWHRFANRQLEQVGPGLISDPQQVTKPLRRHKGCPGSRPSQDRIGPPRRSQMDSAMGQPTIGLPFEDLTDRENGCGSRTIKFVNETGWRFQRCSWILQPRRQFDLARGVVVSNDRGLVNRLSGHVENPHRRADPKVFPRARFDQQSIGHSGGCPAMTFGQPRTEYFGLVLLSFGILRQAIGKGSANVDPELPCRRLSLVPRYRRFFSTFCFQCRSDASPCANKANCRRSRVPQMLIRPADGRQPDCTLSKRR